MFVCWLCICWLCIESIDTASHVLPIVFQNEELDKRPKRGSNYTACTRREKRTNVDDTVGQNVQYCQLEILEFTMPVIHQRGVGNFSLFHPPHLSELFEN